MKHWEERNTGFAEKHLMVGRRGWQVSMGQDDFDNHREEGPGSERKLIWNRAVALNSTA